jgi:hypothetical protein
MVIRGGSEVILLVMMAVLRRKLFEVVLIIEKFSLFLFWFSTNGSECAPGNDKTNVPVVPVKVLMMKVTFTIVLTDFMKVIHVELR